VEYDDNNIEHAMGGPDYGDPSDSKEHSWTIESSTEYKQLIKLGLPDNIDFLPGYYLI
jgi:hypothetical protein